MMAAMESQECDLGPLCLRVREVSSQQVEWYPLLVQAAGGWPTAKL